MARPIAIQMPESHPRVGIELGHQVDAQPGADERHDGDERDPELALHVGLRAAQHDDADVDDEEREQIAVLTIAVLVTIVILATIYPEFRDAVFLLGGVYAGSGLLVWALYNAF